MNGQYLYVKVILLISDCSGILFSGWVCGRSHAVILGSNPAWGMDFFSYECCMSSGIVFDVDMIIHIEESYRMVCAQGGRQRIHVRERHNPESYLSVTENRTLSQVTIRIIRF